MKEEYFKKVIDDITLLCNQSIEKTENRKGKKEDIENHDILQSILELAEDKKDIREYLIGLSDTTLNVICALMDFGRRYKLKILPINLDKIFNKYYLPNWFDKNKSEKKEWIADYLSDKRYVLPKYLRRAEELLIYSKSENICLTHECGGCLIETDGERFAIDSMLDDDFEDKWEKYELKLTCLKCGGHSSKTVDKSYFNKAI